MSKNRGAKSLSQKRQSKGSSEGRGVTLQRLAIFSNIILPSLKNMELLRVHGKNELETQILHPPSKGKAQILTS